MLGRRAREAMSAAAAIGKMCLKLAKIAKKENFNSHHSAALDISSVWGGSAPAAEASLPARHEPSHTASLVLLTQEARPHKSAGLPPHCH